MNIGAFGQLITQLLDHNNTNRAAAEQQIDQYVEQVPDQYVQALCVVIGDGTLDPAVSTLCAMLVNHSKMLISFLMLSISFGN
jgi:hypothetical protein